MDGLPLEVLQAVFAHVPQLQAVECLPGVCRRFRQALQGPSRVWESLEEDTLRHVPGAWGKPTPALTRPSCPLGTPVLC
jgi:hypothetical protein